MYVSFVFVICMCLGIKFCSIEYKGSFRSISCCSQESCTKMETIVCLVIVSAYLLTIQQKDNISSTLITDNAIVLVLINSNVFDIAVVPEQPTNLQGESLSPNSIQLTWDAPESTEANLESYELYFNDSHFRQNIRVTINPPRNSYLLEDLTPDTIYHIRVSAKSSRGEGASTPTIQVRTMDYGRHINN